MISGIIKVEVSVTLTETLIILDITKTESNNCFNVANYYLGKVKRERSWPVVSAFAVRDLRGGPWILQGLLWARGQRCLCIVALLADRIGSIAYYCHGSLQRVADSR